MSATKTAKPKRKSQHKRRKRRYFKRFRKKQLKVKRGRSWMSDPLLVRFYRTEIIPFFDGRIPSTISEYEEQLAIFFNVDYREIYHAQITQPFKLPGNIWVGDYPSAVSTKWGKRDMWPNQRILIRFDRRDEGARITLEFSVKKDVQQVYTLTNEEWCAIKGNIRILVPLYTRGRKRENLELIKEHHNRSIRVGLGSDVKIKFINKA